MAAKQIIKVGARKVDVTGLTPAMQKKVVDAAKNGKGSKASRALAAQFQKQVSGNTPKPETQGILKTGGLNPTIQDPQRNMNIDPATGQPVGGGQGAPAQPDPSQTDYNPEVPTTPEVQGAIPSSIAGKGQYKETDLSFNSNRTGVDKETGAINPDIAAKRIYNNEQSDFQRNFNANNPGLQVDEFGNRQDITIDPSTGETKVVKTAGGAVSDTMGAFKNAIGGFTSDLSGQVSKAQNANYDYMTRNLAQQKQQDLEASKQELAQRGIPLDPSSNSLWGKTIGNINNRYQDLTDQANQQSIMLGNQTLGAQTGAQNSTLGTLTSTANAFRQNATPFQGANVDSSGAVQGAINSASGANLGAAQTRAEIEKAKIQAAAQKEAAKAGAEKSKGPVFNS